MDLPSCSADSLAQHEPLIGTAGGPTRKLILVEYAGPWGRSVPDELPQLHPGLRERLIEAHAIPGQRVLCLRRPQTGRPAEAASNPTATPTDALTVGRIWLVDCSASRIQVLARCRAEELAALHSDDWWQLTELELWEGPLLLVCTHGVRDRCCALHGMPLFRELDALDGAHVFQCSHLGGHRFAPVVLSLPSGVVYGRVPLDAAAELLESARARRWWHPDHVRGNLARDEQGQVAELAARRELGRWEDDAVVEVRPERDGSVAVSFRAFEEGASAERIRLRIEAGEVIATLASCGDAKRKEFVPLHAVLQGRTGP